MKNKQKILNEAFYVTIFLAAANVIAILFEVTQLTFAVVIFLIVYLVLGFFTKRSSLIAALALLILFSIDSILWMINWLPRTSSPVGVYVYLLMRVAFWWAFYKAYLTIKHNKKVIHM